MTSYKAILNTTAITKYNVKKIRAAIQTEVYIAAAAEKYKLPGYGGRIAKVSPAKEQSLNIAKFTEQAVEKKRTGPELKKK